MNLATSQHQLYPFQALRGCLPRSGVHDCAQVRLSRQTTSPQGSQRCRRAEGLTHRKIAAVIWNIEIAKVRSVLAGASTILVMIFIFPNCSTMT